MRFNRNGFNEYGGIVSDGQCKPEAGFKREGELIMIEHKLDGVSETLLIPLWARAAETSFSEPIIRDDLAVEMINKIDYDFSKLERARFSQVGVAIRTELLDKAVREFITRHMDSVVINLGCGLDTRYFRVDNGRIRWYDLDLPEPIRLRRQFFSETERYRMLEKSVFDADWYKEIQRENKPVLIVAEGLLMYFNEQEVKQLLAKLVCEFPKAEMLLEVLAPLLVKNSRRHDSVRKMNAPFCWGAAYGSGLEALNKHIQFIEEWNYFDYHRNRWGWLGLLALIPALKARSNNKIVHVKFV